MRINKHDTNGTKPLLGKGELGYDDYTAGGDIGRVYVGTSSENIALAKRLETNMMTKAQFNALAEERKANRAGSGFDEWGKHYTAAPSTPINTGLFTMPTYVNQIVVGWDTTAELQSKTKYPIVNINGILHKIFNRQELYQVILLPTAPNIYPYNTVLTTEQTNSGVIKHADASNSGLIVNGKFDTDTSGWTVGGAGAVISWDNGKLKVVVSGTGTFGWAYQSIPTIIGKKYIITYDVDITSTSPIAYAQNSSGVEIARSITKLEKNNILEFIATTSTTRIAFGNYSINTTNIYDNIAVYPADAISRSDLVFLESWHEDISEKNFVYPLGNTQYLGANTDGLTGIANGVFTGFETYSLFGNWQTPSGLIGKGYVWSNLTEAQRKAFIANPDNNCYLDGDKVIQVRYRVRVVQGWGDSWLNVDPQANTGVGLQGLLFTGFLGVQVKGKQTSIDLDIRQTLNNFTNNLAFLGGSSTALNKDEKGVFGYRQEIPSSSYTNSGFALPIALVSR